jgi:hypothetical protein
MNWRIHVPCGRWALGLALIAFFLTFAACSDGPRSNEASITCVPGVRSASLIPSQGFGRSILDRVTVLTGSDLKPYQTCFNVPELADPFMTLLKDGVVISGTAQYMLRFRTIDDIAGGGPYQVIWNDFYYSDLTPMEGNHFYAHSWDMKPVPWVWVEADHRYHVWDPAIDRDPPQVVWYGGHMRPQGTGEVSRWPEDNFSRDVFAFVENTPGKWVSLKDSIFVRRKDWPRASGSFLGHRYGSQIVMVPKAPGANPSVVPVVFFEEVTEVRSWGGPAVTKIFMDEMASPYEARGNPVELVSPIDPVTGQAYPSAVREDGSALVEGPLYFRFRFDGEEWEAIGFSAGSFYGRYPAVFASRRVQDGFQGRPFRIDLNDEGDDFNDAGEALGKVLDLVGGPARPSVLVNSSGQAILDSQSRLQVLVHGYRKDILPDADDSGFPTKYRLDQMFRILVYATLEVSRGPLGALRFRISVPEGQAPNWSAPLAVSVK